MHNENFQERLHAIRRRFAGSLPTKIEQSIAELPNLCGVQMRASAAVEGCYRRIHGISGLAAIVGFAPTGQAAKRAEDALADAFRARRGLTPDEATLFAEELHALSAAAASDLGHGKTVWRVRKITQLSA